MKKRQTNGLKLGVVALAVALMAGCGGSADSPSAGAPTSETTASVLAVTKTAAGLSVSTPAVSATSPATVLAQSQYTFAATLTAGPNAGRSLSGTLMLKAESEDGATELEGRLVLTPATPAVAAPGTSASATAGQVAALQEELRSQLSALRTAYRADIDALAQTARAALSAGAAAPAAVPASGASSAEAERNRRGPLTAAQREAIQTFKSAFAARTAQFHADVAAATLAIDSQLAALGVTRSGVAGRGDDEGEGRSASQRGFKVEGTLAPDGRIDLTLQAPDKSVWHATGQAEANGNWSGPLTGPAAGDVGTWTASPGTGATPSPPPPAASAPPSAPTPPAPPATTPPPPTPPVPPVPPVPPAPTPPPPPPAPVGSVSAGSTKYANLCAGCHTSVVRTNVLNVTKASTVGALNAAITKVGTMRSLDASMSAQDRLDVAAYISSAK